MNEPAIRTRRDLFAHLERQMDASYRQVLGTRRLDYESTFLKTYLLESAPQSPGRSDGEPQSLVDALTIPASRVAPASEPSVRETDEQGLFIVEWPFHKPVTLYLDTTSSGTDRFWVAHSLGDAGVLDRAIKRITQRNPSIDRVWFWPEFLESAQGLGEFRGVGVNYDHRGFERAQGTDDPDDFLSIQLLGGTGTEDILAFLQGSDTHGARTVVSRISLKLWSPEHDGSAREDIYHDGKFTARGSSFRAHHVLVMRLLESYVSFIDDIEARHVLRQVVSGDVGPRVSGEPIFLVIEDGGIPNVDVFCDVVFSGRQPFRLWGMPRPIPGTEHGRQVMVTDIHTGSEMYFEIYPDEIAMYLYEGACGNTVARLYGNLQQAIGCRVRMEDNDGQRLLQPDRLESSHRLD